MENLNSRLSDIRYKMQERERVERQLKRAKAEESNLINKKQQLFNQLRKEEKDVEKLEKMSFTSFFHMLKGDKGDKIYDEKKEALAAKLKYDEAVEALNKLSNEISELEKGVIAFGNLDGEYAQIINEKEVLIKVGGYKENSELNALMEKQVIQKSRIKEINEALAAGNEVISSLARVEESLNSAEGWSTYDLIGGGIIADIAKHGKIDEAREEISNTQGLLRKFHRELGDIGDGTDISIDIGSFLTFADYFFDDFFSDFAVRNRINESQDKVEDTHRRVSRLMLELEGDLSSAEEEIKKIEKERISIIEQAQ